MLMMSWNVAFSSEAHIEGELQTQSIHFESYLVGGLPRASTLYCGIATATEIDGGRSLTSMNTIPILHE